MTDDTTKKLLVKRPSRVKTDDRGRSVWADPYETAQLELVSTTMLKQVLTSEGSSAREAMKNVAESEDEGVLARDVKTGYFEIIEDDDLQAILDENQGLPQFQRPAEVTLEPLQDHSADEELSLVSTQALRKILDQDGEGDGEDSASSNRGASAGGFDPYNSS